MRKVETASGGMQRFNGDHMFCLPFVLFPGYFSTLFSLAMIGVVSLKHA
jgi:hypothetical protein